MSGIGALPGVNLGGEVAVHVRHDEYFGELGLGRWHPQNTYVVTETVSVSVEKVPSGFARVTNRVSSCVWFEPHSYERDSWTTAFFVATTSSRP